MSPLLFIIAAEIFAIKIRNNKYIKGLEIQTTQAQNKGNTKLKQFADDTTMILKDEQDITVAVNIVENFCEFSGLQLSKKKSEASG